MSLKIIGAGLGRTGTTSLKLALEQLLDGACYHMVTISSYPEHIALWHGAAKGEKTNWKQLFNEFSSMTDWPAAAFYKELMQVYPDAKVLLSHRDPERWYVSCQNTIFPKVSSAEGEWGEMIRAVIFNKFFDDINNKEKCIEAYKAHLEEVRSFVPKERLIEWQTGDGWGPICKGLNIPEPEHAFPHVNTTRDFQSRS